MSDANRTALRYAREVTDGVAISNPAFQEMLVRSSSLKYNPQTVTDDQIRTDEQIQDQTLVGYDVQGDIQTRLNMLALDDLLESGLYGTWNQRLNATPTAVSGTGYTVASGGASFVTGLLVYASGYTTAGNNGLKTIGTSTGTSIVTTGLTIEATATGRVRTVGMSFGSADAVTNAAGQTLTVTAGDFTALGLVAGNWIRIGGSAAGDQFTTAGCNGWARVSAVAAKVLTFDVVPSGWGTDTGTGKTIKIWVGDYLRNSTTNTTYCFEREYTSDSIGTIYEYFRGVKVGKFGMKMSPRSNIEVNFELMGRTASELVTTRGAIVSGGASVMGTPTTVAAITGDLLNTSSNVAQLRVNGTILTGASAVTEFNLDSDRNLRSREGIGSMAVVDIRRGRANVTAGATCYFENTALINLVRQDTRTSVDFGVIDQSSITTYYSGYYFDLPRVKVADGSIDVEGVDTDIMTPLKFQAMRHETLGYTIQIQRYHYLQVQ